MPLSRPQPPHPSSLSPFTPLGVAERTETHTQGDVNERGGKTGRPLLSLQLLLAATWSPEYILA